MIAMQYRLVLPADYDMGIVDRRIAERGHLTDGFPGLAFKAYLLARKAGTAAVPDNAYAPFYVWKTTEGMNDFLCGPGFRGLVQSFGRPAVQAWSVWKAAMSPQLASARHATVATAPIARDADLEALRRDEIARSERIAAHPEVLASVAAFDPAHWSLVRFLLWRALPGGADMAGIADIEAGGDLLVYEVGHVSTG